MFERFAGKGKCQNPSVCKGLRNFGILRMGGGVTRSQTRRDTNFAIPGYSLFCHDTTARGKNKDFSVCGHLCGQSRFYAAFGNRRKSRKCRCHKALRRFALPRPGYRHGTPKPGAIPTSLYPEMFPYPIMFCRKKQQAARRKSVRGLTFLLCPNLALSSRRFQSFVSSSA